MKSTRAASLLKGVLVFLAALMLSYILQMRSITFIMRSLVSWGVLALVILFQPEIRRILEEVGSRRFNRFLLQNRGWNRRGAGHRPDGTGLHGDVPVPHRRPDRV